MIIRKLRIIIPAIFIYLFTSLYASPPTPYSQSGLSGLIKDLVIMNRLEDFDRLRLNNPERFSNLDLCEGFYETGTSFYTTKKRMLSLKTFLKGALIFQDSPYKEYCMLYAAKIYYQKNNRNSALFYINRGIEMGNADKSFLEEAEKLKRRIRWEYIDSSAGLPDNSISAIGFDGDDVWIGMWVGGLCRFTRSSRKLTRFTSAGGLISGHVRSLAVTKDRVWVGTYEGLFSFDKKREKWSREKSELGSVPVKQLKTFGGRLYAATLGNGLYMLDGISSRWKRIFHQGSQVSDILLSGGILYIATLDSGLYIHKDGTDLKILSDCSPKSICMHGGLLWVGTHGNGIFLLDSKNSVVKHITTANGLTSDYIESVRDRNNSVFIGTLGGGAMSYNFLSRRWSFVSVLGGLPSDDVVDINFEKNRIWFGTLSGGIGILLTENFDDI